MNIWLLKKGCKFCMEICLAFSTRSFSLISTTSCSVPYLKESHDKYHTLSIKASPVILIPVPHVDCGLGGQVAKNEEQEFIVVSLVGQISGEGLLHGLHDGVLLRVDEALEHHSDGHVHVVLAHPLPQVHLGVGLGDSDHALYVPGNTEFIESIKKSSMIQG